MGLLAEVVRGLSEAGFCETSSERRYPKFGPNQNDFGRDFDMPLI